MTSARPLRLITTDADIPPGGLPWDIPVPLGAVGGAPPPFPIEVFPGWLADMVTGVARFTQTDSAMVGPTALAVLSACAGGRLEVEPVAGWREPVNIFTAVIAGPGERKSPVHRALTAPLFAAEKHLAAKVSPLIEEAAALKDIAGRQAEQAKAVAAKLGDDQATADAVAAAINAEAITVPTLPRLIVDDATPEKLMGLMAANGGRMAIISDEGGIFDILAGRYSGAPNLDPYLKGHAGQPMSNERQTREGVAVAKPALTVCVMAQPSVLRRFGGNVDLAGRGMVARFLFALPKSLAGWREVEPEPIGEHITAAYGQHIHDLAATFAEWEDPAVVTLTPDAREVRVAAAREIEHELRPGGSLHDMREWANKLAGHTLRLAGLLHVAHHPADAWRRPVDAGRMTEAVALARFFVDHYRAALATITSDNNTEAARHALGVLVNNQMNTFTRREIHRRCHRQLPRAADVAAILEILNQHGWIRPTDRGYLLHPHASHYAATGDTVTIPAADDITKAQPATEPVTTLR